MGLEGYRFSIFHYDFVQLRLGKESEGQDRSEVFSLFINMINTTFSEHTSHHAVLTRLTVPSYPI